MNRKFIIEKANGETLDPEADYFVLRIDNDRDALFAIRYWAMIKGNDELFRDMNDKIYALNNK